MFPRVAFLGQYPVPSKDLPLTFISLEEWTLVRLHGPDVIQCLHNQFTCDIQNLNKHKYSFAAHCNPKGKMISNLYVFHLKNQEMAFIERLNICKKQIEEMKKYMVFSNVTVIPDYNAILIGIAGTNARNHLSMFFSVLPNKTHTIIHTQDVTLLYLSSPSERFLLIINKKSVLDYLLNESQSQIQFNDSRQWVSLDMEAGYPIIEPITSELFIPQAVNMDILDGISFNKGCYIGQESIARIKYRGYNKQTLYRLNGVMDYKKNYNLPAAGDQVELKINNQHWKNVGIVLQSCQIKKDNIWVQVVLNRSILEPSELRITNTQTHDNLMFYY
ncbi:putative aminomethyltransferase [Candidatus Blochmanniella pennsylvanica str. BPEN]|uniref:tRNA-modifying protein YgfZ n=1 Tax=Blochmanniella pennsylvanica (strain BPEN) TaxID=291272 RepID=YGFZ_BLOPB|nr:tRNA-modifying protein YgfZ [Candidatus Blochmannia pennsylvanicus]Q493E3.1 RecName: Full=tRNA-modifying protein YgfZ [Candidatus Blochmannia pennsylvanicus str. BPEN]AAZ40899.1 putative aminomethyltransferase [Candidatus Blochmannia pennsylvanicus str. BPEN]